AGGAVAWGWAKANDGGLVGRSINRATERAMRGREEASDRKLPVSECKGKKGERGKRGGRGGEGKK
ncbi:hypothetical protein OFC04_26115, partial [Escherichia coli]|nr:hypothetical protein [Escherichia coli]